LFSGQATAKTAAKDNKPRKKERKSLEAAACCGGIDSIVMSDSSLLGVVARKNSGEQRAAVGSAGDEDHPASSGIIE
jgi:hypothetical protein